MKRFLAIAVASQLLNISTSQLLFAQKCVNPHFDAQRLDFRDLGYPGATEIPADSSPITALLAHRGNGKVYGATSGKASHLFVWDARVNKVFPLGVLPQTQGVHGCLAEGKDGIIYIGPMGCRTGCYFLTRGLSDQDVLDCVRESFRFMATYEGEIPGAKVEECGNYQDHDLKGCNEEAAKYFEVVDKLTVDDMKYTYYLD